MLQLVVLLFGVVLRRTPVAEVVEVEHVSAVVSVLGAGSRLSLPLPLVGLVLQLFEVIVLSTKAEGAHRLSIKTGVAGDRVVAWAAVSSLLGCPVEVVVLGSSFFSYIVRALRLPVLLSCLFSLVEWVLTASIFTRLLVLRAIGASSSLAAPLVRLVFLGRALSSHIIVRVERGARVHVIVIPLPHALHADADDDEEDRYADPKVQGDHQLSSLHFPPLELVRRGFDTLLQLQNDGVEEIFLLACCRCLQ